MARPSAPVDPFCNLNGPSRQVQPDDADPHLAALAGYAKGLDTTVWVFPDGKIGLANPSMRDTMNSRVGSILFGEEGASLGQTASQAFQALHDQSERLMSESKLFSHITRAGEQRRLEPIEPIPSPIDVGNDIAGAIYTDETGQIGLTVDSVTRAVAQPDDYSRTLTGRKSLGNNPYIIARSALARMGEEGQVAARLFTRRAEVRDRILNKVLMQMNEQAMRLTPEERASGYQLYVEKGVLPKDTARAQVLEDVYQQMNKIDNEFYAAAQQLGLDVKPKLTPNGRVPTGRYFPHRFDVVALSDRSSRLHQESVAALIEDMRANGATGPDIELQALAEKRIKEYVVKNGSRIAGSLERDRLGVPWYIKDFVQSYTATYTRNATRIADVSILGKGDYRITQLRNSLLQKGDIRGASFLEQFKDLEVGGRRVGWSSDIMRELYNWQGAKLTLAVFSNMSQGINVGMRVGLKPFLKAVSETNLFRQSYKDIKGRAEGTGALPVTPFGSDATARTINEGLTELGEHGFSNSMNMDWTPPVQKLAGAARWIRDKSLLGFRFVETWNRAVAQRAGEIYFDQLVEQLAKRGEAGLLHKRLAFRLQELDLSPTKVLAAVKGGDNELIGEMRTMAGLRISNETQFRSDYLSMPLYANNSELGRFMFQFKNFSFGQAKFMMNELSPHVRKNDPARFIRAVAAVTAVYPAVGMALTSFVRVPLMGPTLTSDEMAKAIEEGGFTDLLYAGILAISQAGSLGILSDIAASGLTGNRFVLQGQFQPPALSTLFNLYEGGNAAVRSVMAGGDEDELARATDTFSRELGGAGGTLINIRRHVGVLGTGILEGEPEEVHDPVRAAMDLIKQNL